jgi:hypothetical protein
MTAKVTAPPHAQASPDERRIVGAQLLVNWIAKPSARRIDIAVNANG